MILFLSFKKDRGGNNGARQAPLESGHKGGHRGSSSCCATGDQRAAWPCVEQSLGWVRVPQPKGPCEPREGIKGAARAPAVEFEPFPLLRPCTAAGKQCLGLNSSQ